MSRELHLDFETIAVVDLKTQGLWNYSHDKYTDISILGYAFDDDPADAIYFPGKKTPQAEELQDHVAEGNEVIAHNAPFEIALWNAILHKKGWPILKPEQAICTMAEAYAMALPGTLEGAALALGLKVTKDMEGRNLMMRMCRPINIKELKEGTETVPRWYHDAKQFTFMGKRISGKDALIREGAYCKQDVEVEREIHKRTMKLSPYERRVWIMDWYINKRGVLFDPEAVNAALEIRDEVTERLDKEMEKVTDGHVAACTSIPALKDWAADYGVIQDSLAKNELEYLTGEDHLGNERFDLPPQVRRAFALRREAGRATSVSKLAAIQRHADSSGRVHNLLQYHGAGTGRFSGRAVQPHNFTRDLPKASVVEEIMELVKKKATDTIDMLFGPPLTVISKLLRGFIIAGSNRKLIAGDYSNVEGRGIAWLSGEEWKLQAFRDYDAGTGPDIYKLAFHRTFGTPIINISDVQRQIGKVEELALGYQGGVGAFQTMASTYGVSVPDEEADEIKKGWRKAHPKIQQYWYDLQNAAISAVANPGKIFEAGAPGRQVKYKKSGSFLWCLLPSGRTLCYPYPQLRNGRYGDFLTYKTVPSADDYKRGRIIPDPGNSRQWARVGTYGGKLAENITQAICRDLLVDAMLRLEAAGYKVVMHIHDEIIVEGVFTEKDREAVEKIMNTAPAWAKDFPLTAECWLNKRYIK